MTVTIPGYSSLTGTPEVILGLMQTARFFDAPEGDEYIESVKADAKRCLGITLETTGDTYQERAESLLRSMAKNHMITLTDN